MAVVILAACNAPAAPHRPTTHATALSIFSLAEAPDGQLWLAAAEGLYRFDGQHFAKVTSYPFVSARVVAFADDGSLWVGSYEGLVRMGPGTEVRLLLEGQDVTSIVSAANKVFVKGGGLYEFDSGGGAKRLAHELRRDLLKDSAGRIWSVCMRPDVPCWFDPRAPESIHADSSLAGYQAAVAGPGGGVWAANDDEAVLAGPGRTRPLRFRRSGSFERRRQGPLVPGRGQRLWLVGETTGEAGSAVEFRDRESNGRYPPTAALEDARGNLWVAYLGRGLVKWTQDARWERWFPEDFDGAAPVQVIRDSAGGHVLSTHKHLYRRHGPGGVWKRLAGRAQRFDGIAALAKGGFLATIRGVGVVRLSSDGRIVEQARDPAPEMAYREVHRDSRGRYWVGAKKGLVRVEGETGGLSLHLVSLPGDPVNGNQQAVDLETDSQGRLWVGYQSGIAWLDDGGNWHALRTDRPVQGVRAIGVGRDEIWVAYRRAGGFSRLRRDGEVWKVTTFDPATGYGPPDTNFVKRDSRGWIWRGTTAGVLISDGIHLGPEDWIHIPMSKGLAANETEIYGFFEDTDGTVWIAGDEGLTHLEPNTGWFAAPTVAGPPPITSVEVDKQVVPRPPAGASELPTGLKRLRIQIGSLTGPTFRDIPTRYRLLPNRANWTYAPDGTIELSDLPDSEYRLEVAWTGLGDTAIAAYVFRVGPHRSTAWTVWLAVLLVAGAAACIGRFTTLFETPLFKVGKAWFMLRRRLEGKSQGSQTRAPAESGDLLEGRYQLIRMVSQGGFSQVFEACDLAENRRKVAVKILHVPLGQDRGVRRRFAQEVAALSSVRHPGVIPILNSWVEPGGEPCIAMPLLDGHTLREAMAGGPLGGARAGRIVRQMGSALEAVHRLGIVHRDLKPENTMLTKPDTDEESAVILDFGTAGLRGVENRLAETTTLAGSLHYMAPERLTGRYSAASDVFSFAVMIMEMLTGKRLGDFRNMVSDRGFDRELTAALEGVLSPEGAQSVAIRLVLGLQPDPQARPAQVAAWSGEIADRCGGM